jgi:hypothetical protein
MAINVGATPIKSVYYGSTPVNSVYSGSELVWKSGPNWIFFDDFNQPDGPMSGPYTQNGIQYYSGAVGSYNTTIRQANCTVAPSTPNIVVKATLRAGTYSSSGRWCGLHITNNVDVITSSFISLDISPSNNKLSLRSSTSPGTTLWSMTYTVKSGDTIELSRVGVELRISLNDSLVYTDNSGIVDTSDQLYGGFYVGHYTGPLIDDFSIGEI